MTTQREWTRKNYVQVRGKSTIDWRSETHENSKRTKDWPIFFVDVALLCVWRGAKYYIFLLLFLHKWNIFDMPWNKRIKSEWEANVIACIAEISIGRGTFWENFWPQNFELNLFTLNLIKWDFSKIFLLLIPYLIFSFSQNKIQVEVHIKNY